jgi:hypothetical protein
MLESRGDIGRVWSSAGSSVVQERAEMATTKHDSHLWIFDGGSGGLVCIRALHEDGRWGQCSNGNYIDDLLTAAQIEICKHFSFLATYLLALASSICLYFAEDTGNPSV